MGYEASRMGIWDWLLGDGCQEASKLIVVMDGHARVCTRMISTSRFQPRSHEVKPWEDLIRNVGNRERVVQQAWNRKDQEWLGPCADRYPKPQCTMSSASRIAHPDRIEILSPDEEARTVSYHSWWLAFLMTLESNPCRPGTSFVRLTSCC